MKKIKFRAWYITEQRMLTMDDILNCESEDFKEYVYNKMSDVSELMQYTGLKDKNDKEIFEGDILRWKDKSTGRTIFALCIYENQNMKFVFRIQHPHDPSASRKIRNEDVEIIGNIHEDNLELLK